MGGTPSPLGRSDITMAGIYSERAYKEAVKKYRGMPCRYCGKAPTPDRPTTVHHRVSVRRGGTNHPSNLVPACQSCNNRIARREQATLSVPPGVRARRRQRRRQLNARAISDTPPATSDVVGFTD